MNMNRFLFILCLILSFVGGDSVIQAAEDWKWPTSMPDGKFSGGKGTKENPYLISKCQDLADLSYIVHHSVFEKFSGDYFVMTRDLVFNENVIVDGKFNEAQKDNFMSYFGGGRDAEFVDDEFSGTFDGCGHTISGMYGSRSCFLGKTDCATIKNLTIKDSYLKPDNSAYKIQGASFFVGDAQNTTISNCHVVNCIADINDQSNHRYGGIIGIAVGCTVSNCTFNGTVTVSFNYSKFNESAGGLFGYFKGTTKNCHSSGTIIVKGNDYHNLGGFAGSFSGNAYDCTSRMNIIIDELPEKGGKNSFYIGGFTGYSYGTSVFNCCASLGDITIGNTSSTLSFENPVYISGFGNAQGRAEYNNCVRSGKILFNGKVESPYISINGFTFGYTDLELDVFKCVSFNECDFGNGLIMSDNSHIRYFNPMFGYLNKGEMQNYKEYKSWYCYSQNGDQLDTSKSYGTFANLAELKGTCFNQLKDYNNRWGTYVSADENQNGLPLPITCGGGNIAGFDGQGTAESPYSISTEAELRKLQSSVMKGEHTKDVYYRLDADINMLPDPMPQIGALGYPFEGVFDGNGHSINDLVLENSSLFYDLAGTVKNLTLSGVRLASYDYPTLYPIASRVGYSHTTGEGDEAIPKTSPGFISNCYVYGDLNIYRSPYIYVPEIYVSGICGPVKHASEVKDCYFKGSINASSLTVDGKEVTGNFNQRAKTHLYASGISRYVDSGCKQYNCYASYSYNTTGTFDINKNIGTIAQYFGDEKTICNNYYVSDNVYDDDIEKFSGIERYMSDSELTADKMNKEEASDPQWIQGMYRPVVKGSKYYEVTKPEGGTTYLDIVPESNPKANYIVNITANNDVYSDKHIWQLPNVAVYVESEQKDYITNGYIDQSSELKYKRSEKATGTLGQLHFSLTQNNKGAHFVCLPGEVLKSDLPDGSDAMIVGKINYVNDEEQVNVVHVDTIPAGVPCFLYVPVTSVKSGNDIDMLMRSGIVNKPVMNADYSSFKGTFSPQTVSEQACLDVAKETLNRAATRGAAQVEDAYYFIRGNKQAEVKPFSAWIESSLGNVRIVDYLLLDEYSQTNEELIENSTDDVNIKLRLTMDADKWTTVCLPFDMSIDEIKDKFGEDTKLEEVENVSYDGTTLYIKLKEATEGIVNGNPYFIKPSASNNIFDLGPRILSNELSEDGYMAISSDATRKLSLKIGGLYGMSILSSAEDCNAYYFTDGTLIQVPFGTPFTLGGFRCWFKATDVTTSAPAELSSVIITHSDGTITDISVVAKDPQATKQTIYDLRGIEKKAEKGIVIKNGIKVIKN